MPARFSHLFGLALACVFFASCTNGTGIFPVAVTSTNESEVVLPNPVSIVADAANSQILVANSNVDIFFDSGSLAVLNVDATDPNAPVLTASQIIPAPDFAGEIAFDGTNGRVTIPFRESLVTGGTQDQVRQYALGAGSVSEITSAATAENPYGIALAANGNFYVVSDGVLASYDSGLNALAETDLGTAEDAGLADSNPVGVQDVAIDEAGNRAFISNPGGSLFVVDLATNALSTAISGPTATRDVVLDADSGFLYALDPVASQVWVFDVGQLATPSTTPGSADDSTFLIATVAVGTDPNGMALDAANDRLYVGNSFNNDVAVIDTLTFQQIARVSVSSDDLEGAFGRGGDYPFALTLGTFNGTRYLFSAGFNSNSVVMINAETLQVVEVYPNNAL